VSLSYYDGRERPEPTYVTVFLVLNAIAAVAAVLFWTNIEMFVAEPLAWATRVGFPREPGLFEYPYVLTWGVPVAAIMLSRLGRIFKLRGIAAFIAAYPTLIFAMAFGWYYLAPLDWR